MAADILMFNAHKVPVGRDQIQHLEMARATSQRFNHQYGRDYFTLPGGDHRGRSRHAAGPGRPQDVQELQQHHPAVRGGARGAARLGDAHRDRFARAGRTGTPRIRTCSRSTALSRRRLSPPRSASSWKRAWAGAMPSSSSLDHLEQLLAPMREKYFDLMANPGRIEEVLQAGAAKARKLYAVYGRTARGRWPAQSGASPCRRIRRPARSQGQGRPLRQLPRRRWFPLPTAGGRWRRGAAVASFVDPKEAGQYMRRLQEASPDELLQAGRVTVDGNEIAVAPADRTRPNGRRGCARPCCPCPRLNAGGNEGRCAVRRTGLLPSMQGGKARAAWGRALPGW